MRCAAPAAVPTRVGPLVEYPGEQGSVGGPPLLVVHRTAGLGGAGIGDGPGGCLHEGQQVAKVVVHLDVVEPEAVQRRELMFVLADQSWA